MAETALQTPVLHPRQVIAALAFRCDPLILPVLDLRVEIGTGLGASGWSLILRNTRDARPSVAALATALELDPAKLRGIDDGARRALTTRPLGNEMIHYLIRRDFSNEPDAQPVPGERMVVARDIGRPQLIALLNQLNAHATCVRAAVLDQAQGGALTLFHLRDDPRRGSTLHAFLSAYSGLPVPVLNAYRTAQGTAYLPVHPPRDSLVGVAKLIAEASAMFGRTASPPAGWKSEDLLFALTRDTDLLSGGGAASDIWHDIRTARFFGNAAYAPTVARPRVSIAVPAADPARALSELHRRLVDPAGGFALPLVLREARMPMIAAAGMAEVAALEADRRVLDRRLRAAKAGVVRQSIMVVAPERAFGVVAQLLQKVVGADQIWRDIRYAHLPRATGTPALPQGRDPHHVFHFGLTAASAVSPQAALRRHAGLQFYWGDPGWAESYGTTARIEIMVPWHSRLHPLPHSWDADQMDAHLRDMVSVWTDGAIQLPERQSHILQFVAAGTGGARPGTATPRLEVYRDGDLQPLTGRTITWFNAVLAQNGAQADDPLRLDWETTEGRAARALQIADRDTAERAAAQAAGDALTAHVALGWQQLVATIDADLDLRMQAIRSRADEVREIERLADALERSFAETRTRIAEMRRTATTASRAAGMTLDRQSAEIEVLLTALTQREAGFARAIGVADAAIKKMREALETARRVWF